MQNLCLRTPREKALTHEQLLASGASLQQVEDWMFEGRISFETVLGYVESWNAIPGRFNQAHFDPGNWRSGIRLTPIT